MKSIRVASIVILLATAPWAWAPSARADECGDAVLDYNSTLSRLDDAMEHFKTCVADSKGTDNCSRAFNRLQSAYDQFGSAVALYIKECR